jgi:micrococcal nuclease
MENQTEKKWYQKPTGIIILLIFFFPVGLYLMWKNELWTKQIRWVVSAAIVIVVIANANNNNSDNSNYQLLAVDNLSI